jgi:hypothetical protein
VSSIEPGQALRLLSKDAWTVRFTTDDWATSDERLLEPAGDVMGRLTGYSTRLGPFGPKVRSVQFELLPADGKAKSATYSVRVRAKRARRKS